ncbi:hypothetical protein M885DRAFT_591881 [Pelagophyceae sp. CCMP2097]|nr:hypothetical protein M885DRAFT_591881 [Pelagophyceae sp. CCMP2097]
MSSPRSPVQTANWDGDFAFPDAPGGPAPDAPDAATLPRSQSGTLEDWDLELELERDAAAGAAGGDSRGDDAAGYDASSSGRSSSIFSADDDDEPAIHAEPPRVESLLEYLDGPEPRPAPRPAARPVVLYSVFRRTRQWTKGAATHGLDGAEAHRPRRAVSENYTQILRDLHLRAGRGPPPFCGPRLVEEPQTAAPRGSEARDDEALPLPRAPGPRRARGAAAADRSASAQSLPRPSEAAAGAADADAAAGASAPFAADWARRFGGAARAAAGAPAWSAPQAPTTAPAFVAWLGDLERTAQRSKQVVVRPRPFAATGAERRPRDEVALERALREAEMALCAHKDAECARLLRALVRRLDEAWTPQPGAADCASVLRLFHRARPGPAALAAAPGEAAASAGLPGSPPPVAAADAAADEDEARCAQCAGRLVRVFCRLAQRCDELAGRRGGYSKAHDLVTAPDVRAFRAAAARISAGARSAALRERLALELDEGLAHLALVHERAYRRRVRCALPGAAPCWCAALPPLPRQGFLRSLRVAELSAMHVVTAAAALELEAAALADIELDALGYSPLTAERLVDRRGGAGPAPTGADQREAADAPAAPQHRARRGDVGGAEAAADGAAAADGSVAADAPAAADAARWPPRLRHEASTTSTTSSTNSADLSKHKEALFLSVSGDAGAPAAAAARFVDARLGAAVERLPAYSVARLKAALALGLRRLSRFEDLAPAVPVGPRLAGGGRGRAHEVCDALRAAEMLLFEAVTIVAGRPRADPVDLPCVNWIAPGPGVERPAGINSPPSHAAPAAPEPGAATAYSALVSSMGYSAVAAFARVLEYRGKHELAVLALRVCAAVAGCLGDAAKRRGLERELAIVAARHDDDDLGALHCERVLSDLEAEDGAAGAAGRRPESNLHELLFVTELAAALRVGARHGDAALGVLERALAILDRRIARSPRSDRAAGLELEMAAERVVIAKARLELELARPGDAVVTLEAALNGPAAAAQPQSPQSPPAAAAPRARGAATGASARIAMLTWLAKAHLDCGDCGGCEGALARIRRLRRRGSAAAAAAELRQSCSAAAPAAASAWPAALAGGGAERRRGALGGAVGTTPDCQPGLVGTLLAHSRCCVPRVGPRNDADLGELEARCALLRGRPRRALRCVARTVAALETVVSAGGAAGARGRGNGGLADLGRLFELRAQVQEAVARDAADGAFPVRVRDGGRGDGADRAADYGAARDDSAAARAASPAGSLRDAPSAGSSKKGDASKKSDAAKSPARAAGGDAALRARQRGVQDRLKATRRPQQSSARHFQDYASRDEVVVDALRWYRNAVECYRALRDDAGAARAACSAVRLQLDRVVAPVVFDAYGMGDATGGAARASRPRAVDERECLEALHAAAAAGEPLTLLDAYLNVAELRLLRRDMVNAMAHWLEARELFQRLFVCGSAVPAARLVRRNGDAVRRLRSILERLVRFLLACDVALVNENLRLLDILVIFERDVQRLGAPGGGADAVADGPRPGGDDLIFLSAARGAPHDGGGEGAPAAPAGGGAELLFEQCAAAFVRLRGDVSLQRRGRLTPAELRLRNRETLWRLAAAMRARQARGGARGAATAAAARATIYAVHVGSVLVVYRPADGARVAVAFGRALYERRYRTGLLDAAFGASLAAVWCDARLDASAGDWRRALREAVPARHLFEGMQRVRLVCSERAQLVPWENVAPKGVSLVRALTALEPGDASVVDAARALRAASALRLEAAAAARARAPAAAPEKKARRPWAAFSRAAKTYENATPASRGDAAPPRADELTRWQRAAAAAVLRDVACAAPEPPRGESARSPGTATPDSQRSSGSGSSVGGLFKRRAAVRPPAAPPGNACADDGAVLPPILLPLAELLAPSDDTLALLIDASRDVLFAHADARATMRAELRNLDRGGDATAALAGYARDVSHAHATPVVYFAAATPAAQKAAAPPTLSNSRMRRRPQT